MNFHIKKELDDSVMDEDFSLNVISAQIDEEEKVGMNHKLSIGVKEENFQDMEYEESVELDEDSIQLCDSDDVNSAEFDSMFKRVTEDGMNYVECVLCFKRLKHSSIRAHFKTHSGLRPHLCDICGSRFTRKNDVLRHKRIIHRKIRPYTCRKCSKTFASRNLLITHLQNHEKNVTYDCVTCGFKFGKKEYYENHVRFLHPAEVNSLSQVSQDESETQLQELEIAEISDDDDDDKDDDCVEVNESNDADEIDQVTTKSNKICDGITSSVQLRTVSQTNSSNEELTNKILDAAVSQAKTALQNIATVSSQTLLSSGDRKSNTVRTCIKASVDGVMKEFIVDVFAEKKFDIESPSGMEMLFNMISEVCADQGQLDGQIEVEFHKN